MYHNKDEDGLSTTHLVVDRVQLGDASPCFLTEMRRKKTEVNEVKEKAETEKDNTQTEKDKEEEAEKNAQKGEKQGSTNPLICFTIASEKSRLESEKLTF
jgi:hypothetical protein